VSGRLSTGLFGSGTIGEREILLDKAGIASIKSRKERSAMREKRFSKYHANVILYRAPVMKVFTTPPRS
jgi:hypothetical protein